MPDAVARRAPIGEPVLVLRVDRLEGLDPAGVDSVALLATVGASDPVR